MMTCPSKDSSPTVGRLLDSGAAYLSRHGVEAHEAHTQAEILVSEAMGLSGPGLMLARNQEPGEATLERLRGMFRRVAAGEPVQYVVGHWPFHDIELKVDPRALIPRPETEELVERVLRSPQWPHAQAIADIGTGTGAIVLSLAAAREKMRGIRGNGGAERTAGALPHPATVVNLCVPTLPAESSPRLHAFKPACLFTAVDLSPEALSLARENAEALGLADCVYFVLGNGGAALAPGSMDIIVSNPPYIAAKEVDALPPLIRAHEPRMALDGGPDGLDILRQIVLDATQALRPGGRLFLEIGDDQGLTLRRLLDCAGYTDVVIAKDFAGHDRYAEGTLR